MDGFLNVLKPSGPTASDVVVKLKKIFSQKKVGHLGTLDPGASGVLPIALGKATRLFDLLTFKTKKYRVYFTFGTTTNTLDSYGIKTCEKSFTFSDDDLKNAIKTFIGKIQQIPPSYSAISINGIRAYDLARQGRYVDLPERSVEIFAFEIIDKISDDTWCFDITCSGGTYMRSIARDLAEKLNTVAYMSCLIRIFSGQFDLSTAKTIEEIERAPLESLLDVRYPLAKYPDLSVPEKYHKSLYNGVKLSGLRNLTNNISDIDYYNVYCAGEYFGLGSFENENLVIKYRLID